jgi:hypothetical protein
VKRVYYDAVAVRCVDTFHTAFSFSLFMFVLICSYYCYRRSCVIFYTVTGYSTWYQYRSQASWLKEDSKDSVKNRCLIDANENGSKTGARIGGCQLVRHVQVSTIYKYTSTSPTSTLVLQRVFIC